jgi:hypothetical protein
VALWAMLLTLGMLNEGRDRARAIEATRLLVVVPTLLWLLGNTGLDIDPAAWAAVGAYSLVSLLWLVLAAQKIKIFLINKT